MKLRKKTLNPIKSHYIPRLTSRHFFPLLGVLNFQPPWVVTGIQLLEPRRHGHLFPGNDLRKTWEVDAVFMGSIESIGV